MMNVLGSGAHADNSVDFGNSWCRPAPRASPEYLRWGTEVFHSLKISPGTGWLRRSVTNLPPRTSPRPRTRRCSERDRRHRGSRFKPEEGHRARPAPPEIYWMASTGNEHEDRDLSPQQMADYWQSSAAGLGSSRSRTAWTGGLGRLEAADRKSSAIRSSWSAMTCS